MMSFVTRLTFAWKVWSGNETTELFEAGVPEKIIKESTGHRSLEALRLYERTTNEQQKAVSAILSADKKTTYKDAIDQQKSVCSYQHPECTEFSVTAFPSSPMNWQQQSYYSYQYPVAATTIQPYQVFNNCSITFQYPGSSAAPSLPAKSGSMHNKQSED